MRLSRYVGVPRAVINEEVGRMGGWKTLGQRMLEQAKVDCPVSENNDDAGSSTHLRDTLELRMITGADPRILIGSRTKGDVLGYVTNGTEPHSIDPVNASVLRFTSGGQVVFAKHVDHPGHPERNDFIVKAATKVVHE